MKRRRELCGVRDDLAPPPKSTQKYPSHIVHCCIVDDHCDILPFVHEYFRLNSEFNDGSALFVHIDAHPDMSIPSASFCKSSDDWNDLDRLYDIILEEEGGISEFIIPLFYQNIISSVLWIRSPWSNQFPDGQLSFHVFHQSLKTDLCSSYYCDEGRYANLHSHQHNGTCSDSFAVNLTTSLAGESISPRTLASIPESNSKHWILDICLDYFSTHNPFLVELKELLGLDFQRNQPPSKGIDVCVNETMVSIQWLFENLPYRKFTSNGTETNIVEKSRQWCFECWDEVFKFNHPPSELLCLYTDASSQEDAETHVNTLSSYWSLLSVPSKIKVAENKHLLLLPHNPVRDKNVLISSIEELRTCIRNVVTLQQCAPLFVTIARSVDDGYTTVEQADILQIMVLDMVQGVLSESLPIVPELMKHDLTEECIERAHSLFHSSNTRSLFRLSK